MSESQDFKRRAWDSRSRRTGGHGTESQRFAIATAAAGNERRASAEELGHYSISRLPLQNADGLFYFMPDYDTPGDPNHPPR